MTLIRFRFSNTQIWTGGGFGFAVQIEIFKLSLAWFWWKYSCRWSLGVVPLVDFDHVLSLTSVTQDAGGVLVANIGSYMGGVDLWQNEDESYDNFDPQSMHDKVLEVVSISGTWHLGKLQVVDQDIALLLIVILASAALGYWDFFYDDFLCLSRLGFLKLKGWRRGSPSRSISLLRFPFKWMESLGIRNRAHWEYLIMARFYCPLSLLQV